MRTIVVALLAAVAVLAGGCGIQRKAADSAIAEVQVTFAEISEQADDLMPDEARSVRDAVAQARDDLDRGNFSATIVAAKSLRGRVRDLATRLPGKRTELEGVWTKLESTIPKTLAEVDRAFGSARRPAHGVRRTTFEGYQRELQSLEKLWGEAKSSRQVGRLAEAVNKAGDVKYRALRLLDVAQSGS